MKSLANQIALVTGAGSPTGIGFASARALGADGVAVALVSTTERIHERAAELEREGIRAKGYMADLTQPAAVQKIIEELLAVFGRLDICVNNAGMIVIGEEAFVGTMDETTDEIWNKSLERNLTMCFLVTRAVLPIMRGQKYGRIINVASTSGPLQAFIGDVPYHAAKAGMVGFTRAVAVEAAAEGITVNGIAPGWIATGSQLGSEVSAGNLTPVGRSGTPEEVAHAVRFLADPDAAFVTGQLIVVDGGNSLPEDRGWRP